MPRIEELTVAIPYHHGTQVDHLREAVESILGQSYPPSTLMLVQNGDVSTELKEYVQGVSADRMQIQRIHVPEKGLPAALNRSILACETTLYARMDSDDVAHPMRLEKQVRYLQKHSEVQIIGGWAVEFASSSEKEKGELKEMPTDPQEMENWFHYRNPFIHATTVFRKSVFEQIGLYNERFLTDQDLELWARVFKHKIAVAHLSEVVLYFRTDEMIRKRSQMSAVWRQVKARYSYNTLSPRLNALKMLAILFRLMPLKIREFGYRHFR